MKTNHLNLRGVLPPMITPFSKNGVINESAFIQNIEKWNQEPLAGLVVNGSNSESVYLDREEKLRMVALTVRYCQPHRHVIAGTGCESLRETILITKACADLGAQSALVLTPNFYNTMMTSTALIRFYTQLADESPIPVLLYNVPKFTKINLSTEVVRILSQHPNIVGMKDSAGDMAQLNSFMNAAGLEFQVLVGTAAAWLPALEIGLNAGILALANCLPLACAKIQQAFDEGNYALAERIQAILSPVNYAVTARFGIAGLKYACSLCGFIGGYVRNPLIDSSVEEQAVIKSVVVEALDALERLE